MLSTWDIVLILAVSIQSTVLAYLPDPKWKAFLLSMPFPFTLAALAIGHPVNSTNVCGLLLILVFFLMVRWLHIIVRVPIVVSIAVSTAFYGAAAIPLAKVLRHDALAFWCLVAFTIAVAIAVLKLMPPRDEPHYRTSLPVWIKLPLIMGLVVVLVLLKKQLGGFMTVFPMVSVIGAYESRHSLWTMTRQMPIFMLTMAPMMVTCYLTQTAHGLPVALALAWLTYGVMIVLLRPLTRSPLATEPALTESDALSACSR